MKKFILGLQLYSVRGDMEANFYGTLKKVKAMGYDAVEFAGLFGHNAEEVKEMCADIGLKPVSAHVPFVDMMADPDATMETYRKIGCSYIVIPYLTPEYRPDGEKFDGLLRGAAILGEAANRAGLTLLYHNHDFEFVKIDGKYALDVIYDTLPKSLLQTEIDTCWAKVGGVDPADYVRKYTGRAPVVHLKDFCGKAGGKMYALIGLDDDGGEEQASDFQFRPVGYGVQDLPSLLSASESAGADILIVEQDEPSMGKTPLECAAMSIEKILSQMK